MKNMYVLWWHNSILNNYLLCHLCDYTRCLWLHTANIIINDSLSLLQLATLVWGEWETIRYRFLLIGICVGFKTQINLNWLFHINIIFRGRHFLR